MHAPYPTPYRPAPAETLWLSRLLGCPAMPGAVILAALVLCGAHQWWNL